MIRTQHAEQRRHERRIDVQQLEWLICYGEASHNHGACL